MTDPSNGSVQSFTQPISGSLLFNDPRNWAASVFQSQGDSLFSRSIGGDFPTANGSVTFLDSSHPQVWSETVTIRSSNGLKRRLLAVGTVVNDQKIAGAATAGALSAIAVSLAVLSGGALGPEAALALALQGNALSVFARAAALAKVADVILQILDPPVPVPAITAKGSITPEIAGVLQDMVARETALALNFAALQTAAQEFRDAKLSGDGARVADALSQVAIVGSAVRDLAQQQGQLWISLVNLLKAAGIQDIPLKREDILAFSQTLQTAGFPPEELVILSDLGLTANDIAALQAGLLALDPPTYPTSLFSALNALGQLDSAEADALGAVPEPTTVLLWGTTMAGLGLARWKRRSRK